MIFFLLVIQYNIWYNNSILLWWRLPFELIFVFICPYYQQSKRSRRHWNNNKKIELEFGCSKPVSTIFQLYRGARFYWWRKLEKTMSSFKSLTNFITYLYRVHLAWARFKLTTWVVIGTDCTGSCKSNYHTFTTTTTPE